LFFLSTSNLSIGILFYLELELIHLVSLPGNRYPTTLDNSPILAIVIEPLESIRYSAQITTALAIFYTKYSNHSLRWQFSKSSFSSITRITRNSRIRINSGRPTNEHPLEIRQTLTTLINHFNSNFPRQYSNPRKQCPILHSPRFITIRYIISG
jgi:hypothetical protein